MKSNIGPDQLGCIVDGDNIDPNTNPSDCKNLVAKNFAIKGDITLKQINTMYGEFLSKKAPEDNDYVSQGAKNVVELTEEGCEMTKSYKIESNCDG